MEMDIVEFSWKKERFYVSLAAQVMFNSIQSNFEICNFVLIFVNSERFVLNSMSNVSTIKFREKCLIPIFYSAGYNHRRMLKWNLISSYNCTEWRSTFKPEIRDTKVLILEQLFLKLSDLLDQNLEWDI